MNYLKINNLIKGNLVVKIELNESDLIKIKVALQKAKKILEKFMGKEATERFFERSKIINIESQ